jgi:hypothetical protein
VPMSACRDRVPPEKSGERIRPSLLRSCGRRANCMSGATNNHAEPAARAFHFGAAGKVPQGQPQS